MIETIGILGFGVVGKAALAFINRYEKELFAHLYGDFYGHALALQQGQLIPFVWDEKVPSEADEKLLKHCGASFILAGNISKQAFFALHDYVLVSPGINLNEIPFADAQVLCELDLFAVFFKKPTIAITGTLGKTTVTKLLTKILSAVAYQEHSLIKMSDEDYGVNVIEGGNIGVGMLDLVAHSSEVDCAVLELSSFQLERSKSFASDIAVLTNFYPNHLDRHETMELYLEAKLRLFAYQTEEQVAIMSAEFAQANSEKLKNIKSRLCIVGTHVTDEAIKNISREQFWVLTVHEGVAVMLHIVNQHVVQRTVLLDVSLFSDMTFLENWLIIVATLYFAGVDFSSVRKILSQPLMLDDHHHRLELCAQVNGVDFYNDSKSTVIQATQAAVKKLAQSGKPLILILGGISKGVDRSLLMTFLAGIQNLKKVYCFGKECETLQGCEAYDSLPAVIDVLFSAMQPGDQVLFSPSGASYDLFENYKHRGDIFKDLVLKKKASINCF